ncbi:MAG TPA: TIGR03960 family B12-binding radical SAM protein [Candidatus Omnitrophota bacterium]|nr:TIGR03960 family B12-binding radical SAM protein [Candidatus Omnitrophota bacterium]HPT39782.1 TIGR03960 family B12-binding radical SAM protein [Candidatus Omnitrophota bacterium]
MIEDLLNNIHKPGQYLGSEWNVSRKDFHSAALSFALGFPDLYEVGMSNLGLRILYGVLNNLPEVVCERFFAPEPDMEAALKTAKRRFFSWESQQELISFDMLGFSLGSELNYTNVLNILDLAGLPLEASLRNQEYPLVIGGGPCTLNPEPLHEFFDLFIIGEAEEALVELLNIYRKHQKDYKAGRLSKEQLLIQLSEVEGVYAPCLYKAEYDASGELINFAPRFASLPVKIKKRIVGNFESSFFPCNWLVPYVQTIHDRITLEIMRGCPNRCRFCQARSQYYPLRIRSKEKIIQQALEAYRLTGYEELSLAGLSVGDYPEIEPLVCSLTGTFSSQAVNLSLPSLKAKALLGNVSTLIAKTKKTGLTFAPEAGTPRLREALAKDFSEEEFFAAISQAYQAGYQHLKLYFLIGLPKEEEQDLRGIIDFARQASELKRKINGSPAQINISINPLIPKPHTPLQWQKMDSLETIREKQAFLRSYCKNRRIKIYFHDLTMGFLEGVFSRGDRRLSRVILSAYKKGARFDAWSNYFSFPRWLEAFAENQIDPQKYLDEKPAQSLLPWDFIDIGIAKEYLLCEFNKTIAS